MSRNSRFWVLFVLLLIVAAFSVNHLMQSGGKEAKVDLEGMIPLRIGEWTGEDLTLQPGTLRLLGTENVLLRSYVHDNPGYERVLFCLTFSAGSHRVAHPPQVCYEGQGWSIDRNEESMLTFPGEKKRQKKVQHLSITRDDRAQEVIVWFRNASTDTSSYLKQKIEMLLGNLFGGHQWTAMVRLSASRADGGSEKALGSLAAFADVLQPHLDAFALELDQP